MPATGCASNDTLGQKLTCYANIYISAILRLKDCCPAVRTSVVKWADVQSLGADRQALEAGSAGFNNDNHGASGATAGRGQTYKGDSMTTAAQPKLLFPGLAGFYASWPDIAYTLVRVIIGYNLFMHG
jgi:hypothetical protein